MEKEATVGSGEADDILAWADMEAYLH